MFSGLSSLAEDSALKTFTVYRANAISLADMFRYLQSTARTSDRNEITISKKITCEDPLSFEGTISSNGSFNCFVVGAKPTDAKRNTDEIYSSEAFRFEFLREKLIDTLG